MSEPVFYGAGFPYRKKHKMSGKLIVLEGTDGVGRSTQTKLLRRWLEAEGYAVSDTGLRRSELTQAGLNEAKKGHTLSPITMSLFYAADFADRLENQIIPAMQAGFVVLSDRYFYSIMARDLILYLKADVPDLVARLIHGRGLNYWEAGMDIHLADNLYDSFIKYQTELTRIFDSLADEYNFVTVDAAHPIEEVFEELKEEIHHVLDEDHPLVEKLK